MRRDTRQIAHGHACFGIAAAAERREVADGAVVADVVEDDHQLAASEIHRGHELMAAAGIVRNGRALGPGDAVFGGSEYDAGVAGALGSALVAFGPGEIDAAGAIDRDGGISVGAEAEASGA